MQSRARSTLVPALAVLLGSSAGCTDAVRPEDPVPEPPAAPPVLPPGVEYRRADAHLIRYHLYEDGSFALKYGAHGEYGQYRGAYSRADSLITLRFRIDSNLYPRWEATGTLREDSLVVRYNDAMAWLLSADMMDTPPHAVFVRSGPIQ